MKQSYRRILCLLASLTLFAAGCTKTVTTSKLVQTGTDGTTSVIPGTTTSTDQGTAAPGTTHAPGKGQLTVDGAGTDSNANYQARGKITIAVDTARATDYVALFDSLKAVYKNIDIQFDYYAHST